MKFNYKKMKNLTDIENIEFKEFLQPLQQQHPSFRKNPVIIYKGDQLFGFSYALVYGDNLRVILHLIANVSPEELTRILNLVRNVVIFEFKHKYFYLTTNFNVNQYREILKPVDWYVAMKYNDNNTKDIQLTTDYEVKGKISDKKLLATFLRYCYGEQKPYDYINYEEQLEEYEENVNHKTIMIYDRNLLVAACLCTIVDEEKYIEHLVVAPTHKRQSLGTFMLKQIKELTPTLPICLDVYHSNKSAFEFYVKNNFEVVNECDYVLVV